MSPPGSVRDVSSIAKTWSRDLRRRHALSSASCGARTLANFWYELRLPLHKIPFSMTEIKRGVVGSDQAKLALQLMVERDGIATHESPLMEDW